MNDTTTNIEKHISRCRRWTGKRLSQKHHDLELEAAIAKHRGQIKQAKELNELASLYCVAYLACTKEPML